MHISGCKQWHFFVLFYLFLSIANISKAQSLVKAKKDLKKLCSRKFCGRAYSLNGHKNAAKWLERELRKNNIIPFCGTYRHSFYIPSVNVFTKKPYLKVNGKRLVPGVDFLPHAASGSGKGSIHERFKVDSDIGIYSQEAPYFYHEIIDIDSNFRNKKALLFLSDRLIGNITMKRYSKPIFETINSVEPPIQKIKYSVKSTLMNTIEAYNVAGYIKGKDTSSWVVLGAHYDHLGGFNKSLYFPGASDNGSGTALLLSLLRYFSASDSVPATNILFIFFSGEELGVLGSYEFIKQNQQLIPKIRWMLNLDIAGTGDDGITVVNGTVFPTFFEKLVEINKERKLLPKITIRGKAPISDHHWFTEAGVPSLYLYTASKNFTYYHHINDRPDNVSLSHFTNLHLLVQTFIESQK